MEGGSSFSQLLDGFVIIVINFSVYCWFFHDRNVVYVLTHDIRKQFLTKNGVLFLVANCKTDYLNELIFQHSGIFLVWLKHHLDSSIKILMFTIRAFSTNAVSKLDHEHFVMKTPDDFENTNIEESAFQKSNMNCNRVQSTCNNCLSPVLESANFN